MITKLYQGFALIAIASGIISLVRLAFGQPYEEVIPPNMAATGVCLVMMVLLLYRDRKTRSIPNGT